MEYEQRLTKQTEIVVQFGGKDRYEKDCAELREILGKVFPPLLEKDKSSEVTKLVIIDEECGNVAKDLTEFREIADRYGILVMYGSMKEGYHVEERTEIKNEWEYRLEAYLENWNENISKVVGEAGVSRCDITFHTDVITITVQTPHGDYDISGNHFTVESTSKRSEEHLKEVHRSIVHALLVELNNVDEISRIQYRCGDIDVETTTRNKISCVLDNMGNGITKVAE